MANLHIDDSSLNSNKFHKSLVMKIESPKPFVYISQLRHGCIHGVCVQSQQLSEHAISAYRHTLIVIARNKSHRYVTVRMASKYSLLRTSLAYQTQQFFTNSTLHGVRYINEEGRPFCERLMWFCFTTIGAVATLIIIVSLWEKFQTNPTITGLDTDFHNWDVPFPAVTLCPSDAADPEIVSRLSSKVNDDTQKWYEAYYTNVGSLSYESLGAFKDLLNTSTDLMSDSLSQTMRKVVKNCKNLLGQCTLKGDEVLHCCELFRPLYTEVGYCLSFNSRHAYIETNTSFKVDTIKETDQKWALEIEINSSNVDTLRVYIHNNDEFPVPEVSPQHEWKKKIAKISFSAKETYTTEDARQLSIKQRRCIFPDEVRLETDSMYTYSACTSNCRMNLAVRLCNCLPPFYRTAGKYRNCTGKELPCLVKNYDMFFHQSGSCRCELGCMNTVYEVEKLTDTEKLTNILEITFVSWPMVRYKREVLFGWVDLLVSFGGIAGLFLGFSLLSGVEMVYYFTMRACCMIVRNEEELLALRKSYDEARAPPKDLNLSLIPFFISGNDATGKSHPGLLKVQPSVHFLP